MASKWQHKNPTHALLSRKTKANASRTCFLRARKFELLLFKTQYPSGDFSFGLRKSLGPREMRLDRASAASFKRQLRPTVGKTPTSRPSACGDVGTTRTFARTGNVLHRDNRCHHNEKDFFKKGLAAMSPSLL